MRKQLHEVAEINQYLLREMTEADRLVFEARMIIAPELATNVHYQRKAWQVVRWFGRREKRKKLEALYTYLMDDHHFNTQINSIFTP